MSERYDYGPLQTYEITWTSGHVEKIQCHQVSHSGGPAALDLMDMGRVDTKTVRWVHFHGEFADRWLLVLSAREDALASVRLVTSGEVLPGVVLGGEADA